MRVYEVELNSHEWVKCGPERFLFDRELTEPELIRFLYNDGTLGEATLDALDKLRYESHIRLSLGWVTLDVIAADSILTGEVE